jgi:ATP synthase protein I
MTWSRPGGHLLLPATGLAAAAGLLCMLVGWRMEASRGLAAAALGTVLVLAFLLVGQLPIAQVSRGRRGLGAMLLLLGYTTRIALLLAALRAFYTAPSVDREVLGVTIVVTALAWTAGAVWAFLRWRPLYVEPESVAQEPPSHR